MRRFATTFALPSGMPGLLGNLSLPAAAPLIQAAFELKVVRSIRDAMRSADAASGRGQPAAFIGPAPNPPPLKQDRCDCGQKPAERIDTPPIYLPRKRIQPSPYYAPCRPACGCGPRGFVPPPLDPPPTAPVAEPTFVVQPPWKLVPWKNPLPPVERPKVIVRVIDKERRGQMIDLFI